MQLLQAGGLMNACGNGLVALGLVHAGAHGPDQAVGTQAVERAIGTVERRPLVVVGIVDVQDVERLA